MLIQLIIRLLKRANPTPDEIRSLRTAVQLKRARAGIGIDPDWSEIEYLLDELEGK